ncbi:MAG: hypothetical protein P1V97_29750 [Planctomycetota bacterium]|nr:hypothetical protein [Planctomycetota bacterium]
MDTQLTELKRIWRASGDPADEFRYLQYRMRLGQLSLEEMLLSKSRWSEIFRILTTQIDPVVNEGDGFIREEVEATETRLNIRLPGVLSEFYLLLGRHRALVSHSEFVRQIYDLVFKNDLLILRLGIPPFDWHRAPKPRFWFGIRREHLMQSNPPVFCEIRERSGRILGTFQAHDDLVSFLTARIRRSTIRPVSCPFSGAPYQHFEFPISEKGRLEHYRALARDLFQWREAESGFFWFYELGAFFARGARSTVHRILLMADYSMSEEYVRERLCALNSPLLKGLAVAAPEWLDHL